MDWYAHIFIGALLAGGVIFLLGHTSAIVVAPLMVFGALSSLVPDLDDEDSRGRKLLDYGVVAFAFTGVWLSGCGGSACVPQLSWVVPGLVISLAIVGAYYVLFMFFKPQHRGITHTLAACAVFSVALYFALGQLPAIAGFVGYASHLVADREIKLT